MKKRIESRVMEGTVGIFDDDEGKFRKWVWVIGMNYYEGLYLFIIIEGTEE